MKSENIIFECTRHDVIAQFTSMT